MKKGIKQLLTISLIILAIVAITIPVKAVTNNLPENVESSSNKDTYKLADGTIVIGKSKFTPGVIVTGEKAAIAGANDLAIFVAEKKTTDGYPYPKMYTYTFGEWYEYVNGRATKKVSPTLPMEIWYVDNVLKQGQQAPELEKPVEPVTKYNVFFVDGQEVLNSKEVEEGKTVGTAPEATRNGYKLAGWIKVTVGSDTTTEVALDKIESEVITSDTVFFAKWSEITKFKVSLDEVGQSVKDSNTFLTALKGLGFDGNYDKENAKKLTLAEGGQLTGLIEKAKKDVPDSTFSGDKKTGYYFGYVLDVEGTVTEATTVILKSNGEEKSIPYTAFDDKDNGKMAILVSLNENADDKTITVVVDLDGASDKYAEGTYTIDWSGVTFQEVSEATFTSNADELPEADVNYISSNWGYARTSQDSYELKVDESDPLKINLTGTIVKQDVEADAGLGSDGYFLLYNINNDKFIAKKTTVTVPKDAEGGTSVKTVGDDGLGITLLMKLNTGADPKQFVVVVDIDGDGDEYAPVTYTIDYSEVIFSEPSNVIAVTDPDDIANTEITNALTNTYHWQKTENLNLKFTSNAEAEQDPTRVTISVTGLLPKMKDVTGFDGEEKTNYYLPIVIKSETAPTEKTKITVPVLTAENGTKVVTGKEVWDKKDGNDNQILILMSLNPDTVQRLAEDVKTRTFDIVVDMDGDDTKYVPFTVTIDWSKLGFEGESTGSSYDMANSGNISKADKEMLTNDWGFKFELNDIHYKLLLQQGTPATFQGKLKQQTLNETAGFSNAEGYYVPVKIIVPKNKNLPENAWTVSLKHESEVYTEVKPSETDYTNGYIVVLFKVNEGSETLSYKIDYDGEQGKEYLPKEETIPVDFTFLSENHITYSYKNANGEDVTEVTNVYENEPVTLKDLSEISTDYRKFKEWTKDDGNEVVEEGLTTKHDEDLELKAHWILDADAFIQAVIKDSNSHAENYQRFVLTMGEDNNITIEAKNANLLLSEMNNTNIPGAIAYILQKGEIEKITLSTGSNKVEFTKEGTNNQVLSTMALDEDGQQLKEKIQTGAQALFAQVLGEAEPTMTLGKMALGKQSFSIELGDNIDSVELAEPDNKTYTFNFESKVVTVKNETELESALGNEKITTIKLGNDIEVTKKHEITREVTIDGQKAGEDGNYSITLQAEKTGVDTLLDVQSAGVTIQNVTLSDVKNPITVTSGSLKVAGIKVEGTKTESAITVAGSASLDVSGLTYDGEHYTKPAVKAGKSATVTFKDSGSKTAEKVEEMEKFETYETHQDKTVPGDTKTKVDEYNYVNYYNKAVNAKIYTTTFLNQVGSKKASFVRYNYYGKTVKAPSSEAPFNVFKSFDDDGKTYTCIGFTESSNKTTYSDSEPQLPTGSITVDENGNAKITGGDVMADLVAVSDKTYYAAYKVTDTVGTVVITDGSESGPKEALKQAIKDPAISTIYIKTNSEIDLTDENVTINRKLSIIGPSAGHAKLKLKNITIAKEAQDVFIHWVDITATDAENKNTLIDVQAEKFRLWQSSLTNASNADVESAIKYSGTKATVDIRWNTFDGTKIKNTFIDVDSALAGGTNISYNTFGKTNSANIESAVTIKDFDTSAKKGDDGNATISVASNDFTGAKYAVKLLKTVSGKEADISINSTADVNIAVQYATDSNQFGNIQIHPVGDFNQIKIKYIDESGSGSESDTLQGGSQVKVVTSMVVS